METILLDVSLGDVSTNATNCTGNCCPSSATDDTPMSVGFICAAVAILFFGSNFVPVKKFETGDGLFFQWVLCSGIWVVGLIVNWARGFPPVYALSLMGGFLWSIGNITVVPIIQTIGLGLGMLIWGSFNLLTGWASGSFGWFGTCQEQPNDKVLNYIGVSLATLRAIIFINVKAEGVRSEKPSPETESNIKSNSKSYGSLNDEVTVKSSTFIEGLSPVQKRIFGSTIAVVAGCFYGISFTPNIYVQDRKDHYPGSSEDGLDYVFGHFCGIYLSSTTYFLLYCIYKKNRPTIYPKLILPGLVSGAMWAIAQSCWFVANKTLGEPVSFPIITTGPGLVASLWGVIIFKEVKGRRNFLILGLAYVVTISGAVLSGLSKS